MKNLHIPNPCSENWEMMSPREKGRFCSVCSKCVIDFTEKQSEEIQQIIKEKKEGAVCGRFYNHQLNDLPISKSDKIRDQFLKYIPSGFQNSRITFALVSLVMFLTGCSKQKDVCTVTTGVVMTDIEMDTVNKDYVMGEAKIIEEDSVAKIPKGDSISLKNKSAKRK
ncbi:hypothetical protein [Chryseobacterium daeguense]|uniref:hypothetical protein n=1 Tax=Chryseobacterium daeguense TaxID=412438 RepID=UPI000428017A|nr:hypothetical protein [Chryseobacterium daeguense]